LAHFKSTIWTGKNGFEIFCTESNVIKTCIHTGAGACVVYPHRSRRVRSQEFVMEEG